MLIGGFQKFSLIDYPDKLSSIVFAAGCNFRCGYCHNPELVDPKRFGKFISEKEVLSFLKGRQKKLDAVVITGGEPTLQADLPDFMAKLKKLGFLAKLDSNGSNPKVLKKIIDGHLADYLAMDIKGPLEKYSEIACVKVEPRRRESAAPLISAAGRNPAPKANSLTIHPSTGADGFLVRWVNPADIQESVKLIMDSGLDYEFRTTVVKDQLSKKDFVKIGELINGAKLYVLQKFVPSKVINQDFLKKKTYSDRDFDGLKHLMEKYVQKCAVR